MTNRLSLLARELGWRNALLYLFARTLRRITLGHGRLICYNLVAQPVNRVEAKPLPPSASSSVDAVSLDDALCQSFPRPPAVISERFRLGHHCLAATVKGRFAGFLWYARNSYEEDEVHCHFVIADPARAVWDFDVYVAPEFRLGRTFSRLWAHANQHLAQQGVEWSFSRISAFNANSQTVHGHFGLQPLGSVTFLCLGPLQLTFGASRAKVQVSWKTRGRPTVHLRAPSRAAATEAPATVAAGRPPT